MLVYLHLHYVSQFIKLAARLPGERSFYGSVNLKSIFSWNFIVQKLNEIFDKILPYEARAESCLFWAMEFQEKMLLRFTDL